LFPHTYQVRDFAPKLGHARKGMIGDCIGYRSDAANSFRAANFQAKPPRRIFVGTARWFASFQSGAFRADLLARILPEKRR